VNVSSGQMSQMIKVLQQINNNTKKSAAAMKKAGGGVQVRVLPNERDNTILVQAPPDKMQTIAEIIEALDRPKRRSHAIPEIMDRMRIYRLELTDPAVLVSTLKELGNLDYDTRLQVDAKNKAIIAFASLADHFTITQLVEKMDGNGREFHVIRLRRLEADYVAGTIKFMMGVEDENKQNQNPYYMRYSSRYGSQQQESTDKFRVDADVDNNLLILRCNDMELREVENLLAKLGEIPARGGNPDRRRVIDDYNEEEVEQILERIRKAWPQYAPNELKISPGPAKPKSEESDKPSEDPKKRILDKVVPSSKNRDTRTDAARQAPKEIDSAIAFTKTSANDDLGSGRAEVTVGIPTPKPDSSKFLRLLQQRNAIAVDENLLAQNVIEPSNNQEPKKDAETARPKDAKPVAKPKDAVLDASKDPFDQRGSKAQSFRQPAPPPVNILRGPDGKLIIQSDDPRVLDLLEDLMAEYAPARTGFRIFKLKNPNTWAYGIELNLEEFFEEEQKGQKSGGGGYSYDPFFGMMRSSSGGGGGGSRRLSKRKPLKFISDRDTHSILVQGATPDQMKTIEDLINLWDKPESEEQRSVRVTKVFPIKYSRAKIIADAIKDVYRDLLSSNDRALENKNQQDKSKSGAGGFGQSYTYIYGGGGDGDEKGSNEPPIKFKGLLSIGIDELSNNLIISASEGLLENISALVETLDEAARPTSSVQVVKVHSRLNSALLQKRLHKIFGKKAAPPQANQQNNSAQNGNPRNGNGRVNFNGRRN